MPRRFACLAGALTLLLCSAAPALARPEPRIINGTFADPGEYPAQGFLELDTDEGTFVCGGTLVSRRHFLTAAHCATQPDTTTPLAPQDLTVTLGKVDKDDFEPSDERSVTVNDVHDDYALLPGGGPENDVALLTLSSDAPAGLDPLRLIEPGESALWADGVTATVIGWGDTEGTGPTGSTGSPTSCSRPRSRCARTPTAGTRTCGTRTSARRRWCARAAARPTPAAATPAAR